MKAPNFDYLFRISLELDDPISVGNTPQGERRVVNIPAGMCEGPLINGRIVTGSDWQTVRPDGVLEIDATYVITTQNGSGIRVSNQGLRHGPPDVLKRLASGEYVDPGQYFFRSVMRFQTGAQELVWLNKAVGVAHAQRDGKHVVFNVWNLR